MFALVRLSLHGNRTLAKAEVGAREQGTAVLQYKIHAPYWWTVVFGALD